VARKRSESVERASEPCARCEDVDGVTLAQTERGSVPLCSECRPRWEVWRDTTGGTWSDWRRRWTS